MLTLGIHVITVQYINHIIPQTSSFGRQLHQSYLVFFKLVIIITIN